MLAPFSSCSVPPPSTLFYNSNNNPTAAVPGRYDVLPPSVGYPETALCAAQPDYATQASHNRSMLDRQYSVLEPSITPAALGVLPAMTRGTGTMLQDPLRPEELKPQKRERVNPQFIQPQGDPLPSRYEPAHIEMAKRCVETSKQNSGHGALDHFTFTPDEPARGSTNALRNFGGGEIKDFSRSSSGFHPRTRITFMPDNRNKGQLQDRCTRLGNPSSGSIRGVPGSLFQPGTAPLGEVQLPQNADVRESANRRVAHPGGGQAGGHEERSLVGLPYQNRSGASCDDYSRRANRGRDCVAPSYNPDDCLPGTEREYAGVMGRTENSSQQVRADLSHQVRGHHAANATLQGIAGRDYDGLGSYMAMSDVLQDHGTQRQGMTGQVYLAPTPFKSGTSAYAYQQEFRAPSGVREVVGRAPGGNSEQNMTTTVRAGPNYETERVNFRTADSAFAQQHNYGEEAPTRSTRMQQSQTDYGNQDNRRITPFIEHHVDPTLLDPLLCNPYVQPLPRTV